MINKKKIFPRGLAAAASYRHMKLLNINHYDFSKISFSPLKPQTAGVNLLDNRNYLNSIALIDTVLYSFCIGAS